MKGEMKKEICKFVSEFLNTVSCETVQELLEVPPEESMGDLALPCFAFAKIMRKNPGMIAEQLKEVLLPYTADFGIEKIEVAGGYCNLYFEREGYVKSCLEKLSEEDFGIEKCGAGRTVCMDYSSPNIAKNFHVGHLRTTVIGNSLYKVFDKLGYHVIRINYLGDWGTQFGKLIVAYEKWSSREEVEEKGIEELLRIYVKFHKEAETDPGLVQEARAWFVRMEQNNEAAMAYWRWFKEISLVEFERVYSLLGVSFDSWSGESCYRDKVSSLASELEKKGLLQESQGAKVIDLSEYDMPPCLITKSDGGSIYHSRDMAAAIDRKQKFDFDQCLYITGLEQTLHFKQVFQALRLMGYDWANGLVHVPYGLVSLAGEKLSTRSGNILYAEDILREAISRARAAIQEKNPDLADKDSAARMVGVGAVIFHDLFHQRIKNIDFSWNEVLNFEGTTGPYVQYTYARAKSILRKSEKIGAVEEGIKSVKKEQAADIVYNVLTEGAGYSLVKILYGYEEAVKKAAERYEPSIVARYLLSVAAAFNRFYHECPILHAPERERKARLLLTDLTQKVLLDGCGLLGMECPEEM